MEEREVLRLAAAAARRDMPLVRDVLLDVARLLRAGPGPGENAG